MNMVTMIKPITGAMQNVFWASTLVLALGAAGTGYVLYQNGTLPIVKPDKEVEPVILDPIDVEIATEPNVVEMQRAIEALNRFAEGMRARTE